MELLISILLAYGITNIIVNGSIFEAFRNWFAHRADKWIFEKIYQLISCMMCMGFWVGAFVGLFLGPFIWWNILFNGALFSGSTWLIHCLATTLGQGYDPARTVNVIIEEPIEIKKEKDNSDEFK
jgi:hypothetical protein